MTVLLIDTSHHNAIPDFARLKAAGIAGIIHKVTEGTSFVDPNFPAVRAGCHANGLILGGYAFARLGDPHAEARFFLDTMRPRPGELVAEDLEVAVAGVDPVGWSVTWSTDVHTAVGCWPFLYGNQSEFASHNWAPVIALGDGQWLAKYDGIPTGTPAGGWPVLTMKQYTDSASIPGEAGLVDADAFQGDLAALLRYAVPGAAPTPAPEVDVQLTDPLTFVLPGSNPPKTVTYSVGEWLAWTNWWAEQALNTAQAAKADIDALAARPPVAVDQAAADLIAASLVANADFQRLIAQAAASVVAAESADLAKRFGSAT